MSRRSHRSGKTTPDSQLDYRSIVGKDWLTVGDAVESRLQQTVQQETSPGIEQYLVSPLSPDIPTSGSLIRSSVYLVSCVHCNKVVLASSFASHLENCPKGPKSGQSAQAQEMRRLLGKRTSKPESFFDDPLAKRRRISAGDSGSDSLYVEEGGDAIDVPTPSLNTHHLHQARCPSGRFKKKTPPSLLASERQENDALVDRTRHSASAGVAVDAELGAFRPSGTHAARVYALAGTPYRTRNRFYAIAACFIDVVP